MHRTQPGRGVAPCHSDKALCLLATVTFTISPGPRGSHCLASALVSSFFPLLCFQKLSQLQFLEMVLNWDERFPLSLLKSSSTTQFIRTLCLLPTHSFISQYPVLLLSFSAMVPEPICTKSWQIPAPLWIRTLTSSFRTFCSALLKVLSGVWLPAGHQHT